MSTTAEADADSVARLHEALGFGLVDEAKEWVDTIQNQTLRETMRDTVNTYEQSRRNNG